MNKEIIGLIINSLAIILITLGFFFNTSMGFIVTELHGALTGIFLLGIIVDVSARFFNRK